MRWPRSWTPTIWILLAGLVFGILASLLMKWGNPPNMGLCVVCFIRDAVGSLGLHRAGTVQYIRPEIIGLVLGALVSAFVFGEFRARGGSAPLIRFLLGAFLVIGALVFLGCPIRATLRLAHGDLNGITGLAGVVFGAFIGILFLRRGFNLGRSFRMPAAAGWVIPLAMFGLLLLVIFKPGFILFSKEGPGALHAALWISLLVGLGVGFLAQRTRMCFVGGWRDLILIKDAHLFSGIAAFFLGALVANLILGQFRLGFEGQPIAHSNHLWNFLGMTLVGLTATLLGGCPFRQLVLSGEGDSDAGVAVLGMLTGAAFAHNFLLASTSKGPSDFGPWAVALGLAFALCIGLFMKEK